MRFLLVLFAGISLARAAESRPLVVLLGDSIRLNYQQVVKDELMDNTRVWSPKDNCRHTAFVIENLDRWLKEAKGQPSVIHINVGLHDMFLHAKTGKTRHTIAVYEKNLRAIFAKLKKDTKAQIIFALTTAVIEDRQAKSKGYHRVVRKNTDVDRFNARARKIATEIGIKVNDLNAFMKREGTPKILRESDGIHLSPEGCKLIGQEVARVINLTLEGSTPSLPNSGK